jgi:hypothetical protein
VKRGLCGICHLPVTLVLDRREYRWVHDTAVTCERHTLFGTEYGPVEVYSITD